MKHLVCWILILLSGCQPVAAEPPLVRACDNDQDYPPFRWREFGPEGELNVHGLGFTLLRQILGKHGWRLELELLPLRRCLSEVASGENYQVVITSSPNAEREQTYLLTAAFDQVSFHSFYLRSRFPDYPPVETKRDLQRRKVCGLAGHNFAMFGLPPGRIDTGAESFAAVFQKLRSGRCEVLPYNLEAIEGLRLIGQDVLGSGEFAHNQILDVPPTPLVMLIAKPYRHGEALRELINRELADLQASGELQRLQAAFRRNGNRESAPTPAPSPTSPSVTLPTLAPIQPPTTSPSRPPATAPVQ